MSKDPWTDPDPQPGDFDAFLERIDPEDARHVQVVPPASKARVRIMLDIDGEDATRLQQLARQRRQGIEQVISELLRDAARHAT